MIVCLLELFIQFKNHKNKCFNVSKMILYNITSYYLMNFEHKLEYDNKCDYYPKF
jgi:hypothetical protein